MPKTSQLYKKNRYSSFLSPQIQLPLVFQNCFQFFSKYLIHIQVIYIVTYIVYIYILCIYITFNTHALTNSNKPTPLLCTLFCLVLYCMLKIHINTYRTALLFPKTSKNSVVWRHHNGLNQFLSEGYLRFFLPIFCFYRQYGKTCALYAQHHIHV